MVKKIQAISWMRLGSTKNGRPRIIKLCQEQKRVVSRLEDLQAREVFNTNTNSKQFIIDEIRNDIKTIKDQYTELSLIIKKEKLKCLNAS